MEASTGQIGPRARPQLVLKAKTFRRYQELLRDRVGVFLTAQKAQLLVSRLMCRLRERSCPDFESYYELVTTAPGAAQEFQAMVNRVTTSKTDFFREPHHFESLQAHVASLVRADPERPIRVWSAGCASGEEPYTIALALSATLRTKALERLEVLASDIDTDVLDHARRGVYSLARFDGVPAERWQPWFLRGTGRHDGTAQVGPVLRDRVRFAQVNLVTGEWPQECSFDAVFCRNTLIYFDRPTQRTVMQRLVRRLRPGGLLFLGHSENLLGDVEGLEPVGATTFRRVRGQAPEDADALALEERPFESRVVVGGMLCSARPAIARTLLGSCVSACLYDPSARVGGMNHFLLPEGPLQGTGRALAYGVHAMETLINEMMRRGCDRRRLVAKAFGAASVLEGFRGGQEVARRNAAFIQSYLEAEGIPLVGHKLGGNQPIDVRFETHTGRAFARAADRTRLRATAKAEADYFERVSRPTPPLAEDDVLLFEDGQ